MKKESKAYCEGSAVAFREAAEACEKGSCQAWLKRDDQAAAALRDMAQYFKGCAERCDEQQHE